MCWCTVTALGVLYTSLNSPQQLTKWTANGGDPCGESWKGITCSGSKVTEMWAIFCSQLSASCPGITLADIFFFFCLKQKIIRSWAHWINGLPAHEFEITNHLVIAWPQLFVNSCFIEVCLVTLIGDMIILQWLEQ